MASLTQRRTLPSSTPRGKALATRRARARVVDRLMTTLLWILVSAVVALLAYFILYTISQGLGVLSWTFITSSNVAGSLDGPEVFNTFYILILALLICVPIGISAAVYLVEYARQNTFTAVVRFAAETLAGIPSLVIGLFGFLIFVTDHAHGGLGFGFSRLSAALTLAVLNLPLLIQVSQEALRSVPNELREASAALGATKSQSIFRVLLPSAIPQLATGIILTAGKMIGETAAIIFTSGASSPSTGWQTLDPRFPGDTLTVHLYTLQAEGTQPGRIGIENGTAALLIICLLLFNLGFRWLAGLLHRRFAGQR